MMYQSTPTPSPWDNDPIVGGAPARAPQRVPSVIPGPTQFREPPPQTHTQSALDAANLRARQIANQKAEQELAATQPAQAPGDGSLTGDEYLKTLPAPMQAQVKALSEGRLPIPSGAALRSPQVMQLWAAASQYDPALDASTYPSRRKAFTDRTSGMMARNITSLNTALGHLESLDASIDKLNNWAGVPLANYALNSIRNAAIRGSGSGENLRAFETARQAATEELTRAFRQSGGSVHDIEGWEKTLDEANSPQELHAAVKQMVDLLGSRVQAMGDQYGQAMGSPTDPMTLLNPHAQQVMQRLGSGWAAAQDGTVTTVPDGQHAPLGLAGVEGDPQVVGDPNKPTDITFSTEKDKQLAAAALALYNDPRSTRADFDALADKYGSPRMDPAELDRVLKVREQGGGVTWAPAQSGHKTLSALDGRRSMDASSEGGALITGAANGITAGHLDEITGAIHAAAKGTSLSDEIALANRAKGMIADSHPNYNLAGEMLGGVLGSKGAGAVLDGTRVGALAARVPGAVGDAGYGALYGEGQNNDNRLSGAISGAALSPIAGTVSKKTLEGVGSLIAPTGGALKPLYDEGVRPTLGQRLAREPVVGLAANATEEALGSVPVFGSAVRGARQNVRDQFQVGAFNSALREIGDRLPKGMRPGTEPHAYAQKAFNDAYDKARIGLKFVKDPQFDQDFTRLAQDIASGGLEDTSAKRFARIVTANVDRRLNGITADGGNLKDMQSAIGKRIAAIRNSPSGDHELAGALEDLSTLIDDAARRNSTPDAIAALDAADKGYAKLVRIETASQGAGEAGQFSPLQFDNAVKKASGGRAARSKAYQRGEALMQDYATAGRSLIDRLPNSGTADRVAMGSALGAGGALGSPAIPAGAVLATLPYLPGVRVLSTGLLAPRGDGPLGRILNSVGAALKKSAPATRKIARQAALNRYGQ